MKLIFYIWRQESYLFKYMTAEAAEIPFDVLFKVMTRVINEVKGVNRVLYDLTSKPLSLIHIYFD